MFTGGHQTPLGTDLFQGVDKAETVHQHANGANDAGLIGINLIGRGGDVVATRGANIGDHRIQFDLRILALQALDFIVHIAGLHRTATGAVDAQDDTGGVFVLEGPPQAADQVVGIGGCIGGNHAIEFNQCGVFSSGDSGVTPLHRHIKKQHEQVDEKQGFEKHIPATRPALFIEGGKGQSVDDIPFPVLVAGTGLFTRFLIGLGDNFRAAGPRVSRLLRSCGRVRRTGRGLGGILVVHGVPCSGFGKWGRPVDES